jgi:hypothetical protein
MVAPSRVHEEPGNREREKIMKVDTGPVTTGPVCRGNAAPLFEELFRSALTDLRRIVGQGSALRALAGQRREAPIGAPIGTGKLRPTAPSLTVDQAWPILITLSPDTAAPIVLHATATTVPHRSAHYG